jgi:hypothetical protein
MRRWQLVCVAVAVSLAASGSMAQFRAASLVVVPAAASTAGLNNSSWHTDVDIRNVDTVPIDVEIVLLTSGNYNNYTWYADIANALGGRSDDGFGHIDEALADIAPGRVVTLNDIVKTTWGDGQKGALLIFAYEAGTLMSTDPPGGVPRNVVVTSRTYTLETDSDETPLTYGQEIPGLPWYDYIDPSQKAKGLDHVTFTGIREDADYRSNLGLVNVSDPLTTLGLTVTLAASDGTELKTITTFLEPLAHVQYDQAVRGLFGITTDDAPSVVGATITVSVTTWQSTAENQTPALMAYVSRADNHTNDPVYLEQAFDLELPWDCVFNGNCSSAGVSAASLARRRVPPLRPPIRYSH